MNYTSIPGTELRPAAICLGSTDIGSTIDRATSFRLLDTYVEAGGNFIDTANVYANWLPGERSISENTIGKWLRLRKKRDQIILATKGAHPELSTMHISRLSRAEIVHDLNDSLKNLGTDVIDLYWLHRDDPNHPIDEILETLNDQVKAGKIRYFGCSNWRTARIQAAQIYAAENRLQGLVANQMMWSLAPVDVGGIKDKTMVVMDEDMREYHLETGLAATPYSSQANGLFQRMAAGTLKQMDPDMRGMYLAEENRDRFERIKRVAAESGLTVTQIVLGYLRSQPFPTIPIVGCRTVEQLRDSLNAAHVKLDPDQLSYLEGRAAR
jgi:aryl-alcohol dehydrogenase-like predicted oxidoreductase